MTAFPEGTFRFTLAMTYKCGFMREWHTNDAEFADSVLAGWESDHASHDGYTAGITDRDIDDYERGES